MIRSPEWWVAPPFDGPPTGGTVYNARLTQGLSDAGVACERVDLGAALAALRSGSASRFWVDSLHLDALPELRRANMGSRPLWLVVHYLPSLVEKGSIRSVEELTTAERAALAAADGFLATSQWLAGVLEGVGVPESRIGVIEPGVDVPSSAFTDGDLERVTVGGTRPLRAVIVANVVPGKGIAPFLTALSRAPMFPLELSIVGSVEHDVSYALTCRRAVSTEPSLRDRVRFTGSVPHRDALGFIARSDVLVSPSRMESFGLALAEARALGIPILGRRVGNAPALVQEDAGGSLFNDDDTLLAALAGLARSPADLANRVTAARRAIRRRTWKDAAEEFVRLLN